MWQLAVCVLFTSVVNRSVDVFSKEELPKSWNFSIDAKRSFSVLSVILSWIFVLRFSTIGTGTISPKIMRMKKLDRTVNQQKRVHIRWPNTIKWQLWKPRTFRRNGCSGKSSPTARELSVRHVECYKVAQLHTAWFLLHRCTFRC